MASDGRHEHSRVRVSIVVVTFNRCAELVRLLRSLESILARPDVEMLLIDDGSTDGTVERVSPLVAALGDRGHIVRQEKAGPGIGRNRGILRARGDIVVFVDTDCVVHPGWLDGLLVPFDDAEVGAVGGPDRSRPGDPPLTRLIDYLMTSFLTTGGVRGAKRVRGGSYHPRSFNMAARRDAALAVDGFPTIWYGEDILFSWRVHQMGWKLAFAPDAWVYHLRRTTVGAWVRQAYRMGRARWWMGRHDRRLLEPVYVLPLVECVVGVLCVLSFALGGPARWVGLGAVVVAVLYLTIIALDGLRRTGLPPALVAVPFLFLLREAAYGLGSLVGLLTPVPDLSGALGRVKEGQ